MSENSLLLSRADSAVMSRDYALAARLYSTLLKDKSDDKELLKRLGNVYIKSGEDSKAQNIYEKLLALEPKNPDFLLTLGGIYRRVKQYDKSIDVLNKALDAGAKDVQVYYNLGFTYKFQENFKDAIDCFETVVTLNPNDVLAYNHMGSIYEMKKDYNAAIQAYQMGLKVDPNHPILHFNLAKTYESSDNIDGAVREYEAALRYKPGWKEAYVEYARLLYKSGRIKDAEAITEQAIKVNDDSARLQSLMGDIYMAEDFYEGAEERYNLSLKSDPKRVKALLGLAKAYEAQGKNADAVEAIQKAKDISPDDDRVQKDSVSINLSAKKLSAANKEIKTLFEKDQDDLETLDLAGQYYICSDDEKSADSCYKKIESFDPSYKSHLKNASKRYKQKGNLKKAQNYIKEYIKQTAPSNARSYVALAQIEEDMGNLNDALAAYNRALELGSENRRAKDSSSRIAASIGKENVQLEEALEMEEDLNAAFEETDSVQIDMGQEENLVEENVEEEDDVLTTDDFDFDAFGKSPLLDDEPEIDFSSIADTTDEEEEEDEKSNDMNLLGDEAGLKEKPEEMPLSEDISFDDLAPEIPEEPAYSSEPLPKEEENVLPPPEPHAPKQEAPREEMPRYEQPQNYAPDPKYEERLKDLEDEYNKKLDELSSANQDLMDKMGEIEDNAKKASDSAEKAWYAAQKAADNAQVVEQSQDEMNERMAQMAEEAAKKAADALEEYKAAQAEKEAAAKEAEAAEENDDDDLDDLFDDILGASVPGEEEPADEDVSDQFSDEDEMFADDKAPALEPEPEPALEDEPPVEEEAVEEPLVEDNPEEKIESPTFDSAVQKATEMIPAIENILRQEGSDRDYSAEIKLFKTLRDLSEALPENERRSFLQSRTRVTLDYLISKLEGRPGLLKTSHALRKSGALEDYVQEADVKTDYPRDELARIVVTDMKALVGFLEEDDLVIALNNLADSILN